MVIGADDLAMLSASFTAALMATETTAAALDVLNELGWGDLLATTPMQGVAATFASLGTTGSAACLLDDVVGFALGLGPSPELCIVLPAPSSAAVPGTLRDGLLVIDGLVSARIDKVARVVVPVADGQAVALWAVPAALLRQESVTTLDPDQPFRRLTTNNLSLSIILTDCEQIAVTGTWETAVRNARAALAHQLIAASRVMLEMARQHAVDRVQFGKPIASFQAVRHKLAESLVAIEGAAAAADACTDDCDPLLAAVAKSLAGKAARTTATHAQQILAGIGFTTDHPFHRSLKRTMVLDSLFGSARTLPTEIGLALLSRRTAPRLVEI